jgi:hypothetical protein
MMRLKPWLRLILIPSVLLLSGVKGARTQSNPPSPEKHNGPAALHRDATNQDNQSALYAALIETLDAGRATRENEALLTPIRIQEGLLIVGIVYSLFAWRQWRAIKEQSVLTREALITDKRAFIYPEGFMSYHEADPITGFYNWRFRPRWRNAGETPTKDATMYVQCEIRDGRFPHEL